jgi:hypothetical protein
MDLSRYGPGVSPLAQALAAGQSSGAPIGPGSGGMPPQGPGQSGPGVSGGPPGAPPQGMPGQAPSPMAPFPTPYAGLPIGPGSGGAPPGVPIAQPGSATPSAADIAMAGQGLASSGGAGPDMPVGVGAPLSGPPLPQNTPFGFGLPPSYVGHP